MALVAKHQRLAFSVGSLTCPLMNGRVGSRMENAGGGIYLDLIQSNGTYNHAATNCILDACQEEVDITLRHAIISSTFSIRHFDGVDGLVGIGEVGFLRSI